MKKFVVGFFLVALIIGAIVGCNRQSEPNEAVPALPSEQIEPAALAPTDPPAPVEAEAVTITEVEEVVEPVVEEANQIQVEPEQTDPAETEATITAEPETEELVDADAPAEAQPANQLAQPAVDPADQPEPEAITVEDQGEAVEFTATTGLETFSAYRMNFVTDFDGTRQSQPTTGSLTGLFEVTRNPEAQHWQILMDGNAFDQLAMLGGRMELYDISNTLYIQNPQDGTWVGVPKMFVESMLPDEMYKPEDNIKLPATAVLQPGEEMVNGVLTRRYTFGADDVALEPGTAAEDAYDQVEGTIWVAVDDNYVVKYEAIFSGRHDNLVAGDMKLLDEGTITMMYEITDVNGEFTVEAPAGAASIDLGKLLFN